jgi:Ni,Fe-hydrogenase III component G
MTTISSEPAIALHGPVGDIIRALGDMITDVEQCEARRGIARIDPARHTEAAAHLHSLAGSRLATATGIDIRDGVDILWHWCVEPPGVVITFKVLAARPDLALPTLAHVIHAANWIEREMHDLLGVTFEGHPDMRRLVLDDTWPEGVHPLRKSFDQILDRPPPPRNQSPPDVADDGRTNS